MEQISRSTPRRVFRLERTLAATSGMLFVALTLGACAVLHRPGGSRVDVTLRRAELLQAQSDAAMRAARADVIDAMVGVLDERGWYVPAIRQYGAGPAAARQFLSRDTTYVGARASWRTLRCDVSADGTDGYTYGYLDLIRPSGELLPGWFLAYWRRGADGRWRALAFRRLRREPGPTEPLPDSMRAFTPSTSRWPAKDSTAAWQSLATTEKAFSDSARFDVAGAFGAFAAPDAAKVARTRFQFGPEAIAAQFRPPPPFFKGIEWHAQYGSVALSNDLGFDIGPVEQMSSGTPQFAGFFFTVWRRQADGRWKYLVD